MNRINELFVIVLIAALIFGPTQLPDLIRKFGSAKDLFRTGKNPGGRKQGSKKTQAQSFMKG